MKKIIPERDKTPEIISENIISRRRSIIPALDVDSKMVQILEATSDLRKVGAYVVGLQPIFERGLPEICGIIKSYTEKKPIIVKAPNIDHSSLGKDFAKTAKNAGADAVILLPYASPEFQEEWTNAIKDQGLGIIVGVERSHDNSSYSSLRIYYNAAMQEVENFLISAKSNRLKEYKNIINRHVVKDSIFYGQKIKNKEDIQRLRNIAGNHRLHVIVGRGIYEKKDMRKATINLTKWLFDST